MTETISFPADYDFCFGNQFGKRDLQCLCNRMSRVETGIAFAAFDHSNVRLMQARFFRESLPAQALRRPVSLQDGGKGI